MAGRAETDKSLFMKHSIILLLIALTTGCATFTTRQVDQEYDNHGNVVREMTTVTKARTLFDSDATLANLETTQDERKQDTKVGAYEQKSSSDGFNELMRNLINAAVASGTPLP